MNNVGEKIEHGVYILVSVDTLVLHGRFCLEEQKMLRGILRSRVMRAIKIEPMSRDTSVMRKL